MPPLLDDDVLDEPLSSGVGPPPLDDDDVLDEPPGAGALPLDDDELLPPPGALPLDDASGPPPGAPPLDDDELLAPPGVGVPPLDDTPLEPPLLAPAAPSPVPTDPGDTAPPPLPTGGSIPGSGTGASDRGAGMDDPSAPIGADAGAVPEGHPSPAPPTARRPVVAGTQSYTPGVPVAKAGDSHVKATPFGTSALAHAKYPTAVGGVPQASRKLTPTRPETDSDHASVRDSTTPTSATPVPPRLFRVPRAGCHAAVARRVDALTADEQSARGRRPLAGAPASSRALAGRAFSSR